VADATDWDGLRRAAEHTARNGDPIAARVLALLAENARLTADRDRLREDLPELGSVPSPPGYSADVYRAEDADRTLCLMYEPPGGPPRSIAVANLPSFLMGVMAKRDELREERDKLQAFKNWVHDYLDGQGVPHDPDPEGNARHGCRIGGRMNWLVARIAELQAGLEPFAEYARIVDPAAHPDNPIDDACPPPPDQRDPAHPHYNAKPVPTVGDCRRAAELLAPKEEKPNG
jgi:hypothetical protein